MYFIRVPDVSHTRRADVGQTLYFIEGKGLVQARDGDIEEIHAGDVVCTPAKGCH